MSLFMAIGDIVDQKCDAIVSAADPLLSGTKGIDQDIHLAAGPELDTECRSFPIPLEVGSVVITKGYRLSRYIIHAVAPTWKEDDPNQMELLASCYRKIFALAKENRCASIALPHISAGSFGFPPDKVLQLAVQEAYEILASYNMKIVLVTHRQSTYNLGTHMFRDGGQKISDQMYALQDASRKADFGSLIEQGEQDHESFRDMLIRIMDEKGMTNSECYSKALVSRSVFSDIISNPNYHPKKPTVTGFVFALELPEKEALRMYGKAGIHITKTEPFDIIVRNFLQKKNYSLYELNSVLYKYGLPLIG